MTLLYSVEKLFQSYLGKFEYIYYPAYKILRGSSQHIVTRQTEVAIEGYPRSGNSFATAMLRNCQDRNLSIASHLHVSAQLFRAKRLRKPLIMLIRHPLSAVSSFVIRDSINPKLALKYYINFYRSAIRVIEYPVVVDFKELTEDFPIIIKNLNKRFSTEFQLPSDIDELRNDVFKEIDEHYKFVMGTSDVSLVSSSPDPKRKHRKKEVEEYICHQHSGLLQKAEMIYERVMKERVEIDFDL